MSEPPVEGFTDDTSVWPILEELTECVCDTLLEDGVSPGGCFCGVVPGSEAIWDHSQGMAWVRLTSVDPLDATLTGCQPPLQATFEIGVMHCAPVMSAQGVFPTVEEQREATRLQLATMSSMQRAITCCPSFDLILGTYTPLGPQGGSVGGTWSALYGAY